MVDFISFANPGFPVFPSLLVNDLISDKFYAYNISLGSIEEQLTDFQFLEVGELYRSRWIPIVCSLAGKYMIRMVSGISLGQGTINLKQAYGGTV